MRTYTQEEILAEKLKIQNIWLKSAFYTSTIIFTVFLFSASKIVDIGIIYKLLFRFCVFWIIPQIFSIVISSYFGKISRIFNKLIMFILFFFQFLILFTISDILEAMDLGNVFTLMIAWIYLLIEVLWYRNIIVNLKNGAVEWKKL